MHVQAALASRVAALEAAFRHIRATRMAGVPVLHPGIRVQAVAFEPEVGAGDTLCGVLITPWFMSLVRLPAALEDHGGRVARKAVRAFGSERFEFIGAHDPAIGYHETCALFSPMGGFSSQAQAVDTALASLALLRPEPAPLEEVAPVPARRAFFMARRPTPGVAP